MRYGLPTTKSEVDDSKCEEYKTSYSRLTPAEKNEWREVAKKHPDGAIAVPTLAGGVRQINFWDKTTNAYWSDCWWLA
jgi:hypothetical protein